VYKRSYFINNQGYFKLILGFKKKKKFQDSRPDDKLSIGYSPQLGKFHVLLCVDYSSTSMLTFLNVIKSLNRVNLRCCLYVGCRIL